MRLENGEKMCYSTIEVSDKERKWRILTIAVETKYLFLLMT